jgi:hypothetical protein
MVAHCAAGFQPHTQHQDISIVMQRIGADADNHWDASGQALLDVVPPMTYVYQLGRW